jgi:hypothetical protein
MRMAGMASPLAMAEGKWAHLPIDGQADSKPAPSVMNERPQFVAQASSLQPMQPGMAALRSESPSVGSCAQGKSRTHSLLELLGNSPVLVATSASEWIRHEPSARWRSQPQPWRGCLPSRARPVSRARLHESGGDDILLLGSCAPFSPLPPVKCSGFGSVWQHAS